MTSFSADYSGVRTIGLGHLAWGHPHAECIGLNRAEPGRTVGELLVQHMIAHAIAGNGAFMKEILERVEGKVPDAEPEHEISLKAVAERSRETRLRLHAERLA